VKGIINSISEILLLASINQIYRLYHTCIILNICENPVNICKDNFLKSYFMKQEFTAAHHEKPRALFKKYICIYAIALIHFLLNIQNLLMAESKKSLMCVIV